MKIYVRAPYPEDCLAELRRSFDEVVYEPWTETGERFYEDEMLENLLRVRPDALITELDRITEKVLAGYDKLRLIGDCRSNPANIQVDACTRAGVPVLYTPGRNTQAVAELVAALVIVQLRNVLPAVQWVKDGGWAEGTTPYFLWMGHELQGKSIGFVGFGAVGRAAAKIFDGFECAVSFYDPHIPGNIGHYRKTGIEAVFSDSDVVSLHLPENAETKGMIGETLLRSMKPSAIFVNAARSSVVDMPALIRLLNDKAIAGAVIDVLDREPPEEQDLAIAHCPNTILTPHIFGASYEVTRHQAEIMNQRVAKWLNKEDLENIVYNRDVLNRAGRSV